MCIKVFYVLLTFKKLKAKRTYEQYDKLIFMKNNGTAILMNFLKSLFKNIYNISKNIDKTSYNNNKNQ